MSDLRIRLLDVYRKPLADSVDILASSPALSRIVSQARGVRASRPIRMKGLSPGEPYLVRAFPTRHRPVQQFVRVAQAGDQDIDFICPADPKRVTAISAPKYGALDPRTREILAISAVETYGGQGEAIYSALPFGPKAGLLNVMAKMGRTGLPGGTKVVDHVSSLYRIRGDRVFADVAITLRDLVITAAEEQLFRRVPGSLHTPPPGFQPADSFKTYDSYGNLQITFFSSVSGPLRFRADIDIDDAAGIQHAFQVIEHTITDGETNPYDIHEILVYHQFLDPGYELVL